MTTLNLSPSGCPRPGSAWLERQRAAHDDHIALDVTYLAYQDVNDAFQHTDAGTSKRGMQMQHVLEARDELAEGRAVYRSSVKELSAKLQSSVLEPTLPSEIDELWHDTVQPALKDLRKTVSITRIAWKAGTRLATDLGGLPSMLVAVVGLGELAAALPSASSVTALVGRVAAAGAQEVFQAQAAVRQHDLVYLLDVNRKLGNTSL